METGREGHTFTCMCLIVAQSCPEVKWLGQPEQSAAFGWPEISVPVFPESLGTHGCLMQEA